MKILVVDDNECIRELFSEYLSSFSICHLASNGFKASLMVKDALLKKDPYDIIFSDLIMPNFSGIDLIEHIRECEKFDKHKHKVILVSSQASNTLSNIRSAPIDYDGYITKPFDLEELYNQIEALGFRPIAS